MTQPFNSTITNKEDEYKEGLVFGVEKRELNEDYRVRSLQNDGKDLYLLHRLITELEDCNTLFFCPSNISTYRSLVSSDLGGVLGAFKRDKLVGFSTYEIRPFKSNIADKYGLDKDAVSSYLQLVESATLEDHRGNGIQYKFIEERINIARDEPVDAVIAYSDKHNCYSRRNLFNCGLIERRPRYFSHVF